MTRLKKLIERFEATMTAISFAEANETETAREFIKSADKEKMKVSRQAEEKDGRRAKNRFLDGFHRIMEAITFAEAGEHETARSIMHEGGNNSGIQKMKVKDDTAPSLSERHDRAMEAITFAEAGEHAYARELMTHDEGEPRKLLVVGMADGFSDMLIDYSLNMAERMNAEIVGLNVIPIRLRQFPFLSEKVKEELKKSTEDGAAAFMRKARERDINFNSMVKFGDIDKSITDAYKEAKRVAFVLTEPERSPDETADKVCIPVFCMADPQNI